MLQIVSARIRARDDNVVHVAQSFQRPPYSISTVCPLGVSSAHIVWKQPDYHCNEQSTRVVNMFWSCTFQLLDYLELDSSRTFQHWCTIKSFHLSFLVTGEIGRKKEDSVKSSTKVMNAECNVPILSSVCCFVASKLMPQHFQQMLLSSSHWVI